MKAIDGWIDGEKEGGPACATSCQDQLLPSSVHIERHSEGHGCLWKCLCELLPGRKYLRSFTVWHLRTADWIQQVIFYLFISFSTCPGLLFWAFLSKTKTLIGCVESHHTPVFMRSSSNMSLSACEPSSVFKSPFVSVRGEFKFPRAAAVVALCVTVQIYKNHKTDQKPRPM